MPRKAAAKKKAPVKQGKSKVGKGKPPDKSKWKAGQSGNPAGRPKKADCLTSLLKEEIDKVCPKDVEKRTWKELIILATMSLAMKGNAAALKEVWERMDGKVKDKLELDDKTSPNAKLLAKVLSREQLKELDEQLTADTDD